MIFRIQVGICFLLAERVLLLGMEILEEEKLRSLEVSLTFIEH